MWPLPWTRARHWPTRWPPRRRPRGAPSAWRTIAALAALGLGADLTVIARVGRPVIAPVAGWVVVLIVLRVALIHLPVRGASRVPRAARVPSPEPAPRA